MIGFRDDTTIIYPFGNVSGVRRGNRVRLVSTARFIRVGEALLGRVIDAQGKPLDHLPEPGLTARTRLDRTPPSAVERPRIHAPLTTGIRVLDALLTCGRGQRMGIFSGSGVGKSVLLGMMARYTTADVNVIALIGERGREVNEFLERDLGRAGLARSVVVVATSDEPALVRVQAALTATAVAEYFRDQRARRAVDDGFADAVRHGPARNRPGRRRAAHHPRLSPLGVRPAAATGRTRRA